jgi:hypothetical protein
MAVNVVVHPWRRIEERIACAIFSSQVEWSSPTSMARRRPCLGDHGFGFKEGLDKSI